jgi:uncharacterized protein (DUF488 family)
MTSDIIATPEVFSIGYERRKTDELCSTLVRAGVDLLVDVRERAWSQRPEFRRTAFATALRAAGVEYVHMREAGNPLRPASGAVADLAQCRSAYEGHLSEHPEVITTLTGLLAVRRVAVFCYEGHHTRCHRGVLLEALRARLPDLAVTEL